MTVMPEDSETISLDTAAGKRLFQFFSVQTFALIYLQKFALPAPGIPPISLPLAIMLAGLGYLAVASKLLLSPLRFVLYCTFAAAAFLSHAFIQTSFSLPSFLLLLVMSGELVIFWRVDLALYRKMLSAAVDFMIMPAFIVFAQLLWQLEFGFGHTLSLERLVPHALLYPGFLYEGTIRYGSAFVRPNGFFMLEPSFLSTLLAVAVLLEAAYFRRAWRLLLFIAALIGCTGFTGILMLAVAMPFVIVKQPPRVLINLAFALIAVMLLSLPFGVVDNITSRLDELNQPKSSGAARVLLPAQQLGELLVDQGNLVSGAGAGSLEKKITSASAWPMVKLGQEYGLLTMVLYMLLFIGSLSQCPNLPLKIGFFVIYNFTGGYLLSPVSVEPIILFCTMFAPPRTTSAPGFDANSRKA